MIVAAFALVYITVGIVTQVCIARAHRQVGWPMEKFFPVWWERWGTILITVIVWPYVVFCWFGKPAIEIPKD